MRGISLTQPWATLAALGPERGGKSVETRSWQRGYRGWLAIHASKGFPGWAKEYFMADYFLEALVAAGFSGPTDLPLGAIVGVAKLTAIVPTNRIERGAVNEPTDMGSFYLFPHRELCFGDYSPNRCAWLLADNLPLPKPIPFKGALDLWEVPAEIVSQIEQQLLSQGVVIDLAGPAEPALSTKERA